MKLALMTCTDTNYVLRSEHSTRDAALIAYDQLHAALVGDATMKYGVIAILDENFDVLDGKYKDVIKHEVAE